MNLFVLRLVMNLVMCMEAAMRNIQHVFIALCDLGVLFLFFFFLFFFLIFFLSRESRKAVNFILRHCTVDQSCKYFTSTKKYQTNNMFCSFTTNKKKVLLFYFHVFCWFFNCCCLDDLFHILDFLTVNKLFVLFQSENNTEKNDKNE